MGAGDLSRLENGAQGLPSDEVIEGLAAALDYPADELMALAGRSPLKASFERRVLGELEQLRDEVRAGFVRVEDLLAE